MIYLIFLLITLFVLLFVWYQWQYFAIFTPVYVRDRQVCRECEELTFLMADGIVLEGVVYEPKDATKTLLFFGGRGHDSVALIAKLASLYKDVRIITYNYRSYGKSGGSISEQKLLEDALHVTNIVKKNFGEKLYLLGFSLGSSLAAYSGSQTEVGGVFLIGAFDSIASLFYTRSGIKVPKFLVKYRFETIIFVQNITAPLYLFGSKDDIVTPIKNTRNLKQKVKNLQGYEEYDNLSHQELLWDGDVVEKIKSRLTR
ncbi:MAG: alpha/beta hydrolase [Epsilonproteobacteria bacterium]|nr:alpha/beta hydrolase [Campylobacterota bacterium]